MDTQVAEQFWNIVTDALVLITGALVLGIVFERLRQFAILGYLVAGTLLGPNMLGWVESEMEVLRAMAEIGVALLLFAIGLEFSLKRLIRIGPVGLGGGTIQVALTCGLGALAGMAMGVGGKAGIAIGAIAALSSTACVIRMLLDRAAIESGYGRGAVGILLLQDVAVVPLVLAVTLLGGEGSIGSMLWTLGRAIGGIFGLIVAFRLLSYYVLSRVFDTSTVARNRELSILLAVVTAVGAAWAAHALDLSPALGAFVAGIMLAETPFAVQVRSDIGALKTLFVTLFFASVGMLGNPGWIAAHWVAVFGVVGLIVAGKAALIALIGLIFRVRPRDAVAMGVCLAQVGEFSFLLAELSFRGGVFDEYLFRLMVSATLVTLLLTPYLVAGAPHLGGWAARRLLSGVADAQTQAHRAAHDDVHARPMHGHVVMIGFGPSGVRAAEVMRDRGVPVLVIDLHPINTRLAQEMGFTAQVGDATSPDVLDHAHVSDAVAVAIMIPEHRVVEQLIHHVKTLAPHVPIVARCRYHRFAHDIEQAGARAVLDEEELVGRRVGREVTRWLRYRHAHEGGDSGAFES